MFLRTTAAQTSIQLMTEIRSDRTRTWLLSALSWWASVRLLLSEAKFAITSLPALAVPVGAVLPAWWVSRVGMCGCCTLKSYMPFGTVMPCRFDRWHSSIACKLCFALHAHNSYRKLVRWRSSLGSPAQLLDLIKTCGSMYVSRTFLF